MLEALSKNGELYAIGNTFVLLTNKEPRRGEEVEVTRNGNVLNIAKVTEVKRNPANWYQKYSVTCQVVA